MARTRKAAVTVDIKIRMREPLRAEIERAAKEKNISMNAEMVTRLGRSFDYERALSGAMDLAYGPRLAVLLAAMGRAMNETGRLAEFPTDWMSVPALFNEAVGAADEVLESFRPAGDDIERRDPPLRGIAIGRVVMGAICDPNHNIVPFKEWAAARHAQLGVDAARLNVAPWDVAVSTESVVRTDRFTVRRQQETER
jgi:hypothetical protein